MCVEKEWENITLITSKGIYEGFQWYVVFNKCFYELVEVSEVYLLVCFVSNSWCISCPLTLTSWPSLEVFPLFGSTFNLRLLMPTLPKKEEVSSFMKAAFLGSSFPIGWILPDLEDGGGYFCHFTSPWNTRAKSTFANFTLKLFSASISSLI